MKRKRFLFCSFFYLNARGINGIFLLLHSGHDGHGIFAAERN